MGIIHTLTDGWLGNGSAAGQLNNSVSLTGTIESNLDFTLNASTTNQLETMQFTLADLQSIYIVSSQNITIKTNSSSSPQDTLTINANKPLSWYTGCGITAPFASNVSSMYFTNGTANNAAVSVRMLTTG